MARALTVEIVSRENPHTDLLSWREFWVGKDQVKANKHDLSASRYRQVEQDEEFYEEPRVTLERLQQLETAAGN